MNIAIKEKWLNALRSGEYKQGKYQLRNKDDMYCCLGVLCDLHAKETGETWLYNGLGYDYKFTNAVLPYDVREWAGFGCADDNVKHNGHTCSFSTLNDACSLPFTAIADLIDKQL